ncbi:MAG: DUF721 domain-containing protein [Synechococcales cyanobacterium C42_A2020_086]|jgi:predicted nucleic acid-binding Zn ribbon protein|nr:DUF721 domain-containing protein [Synechococcales cyanobacterium C42_A2020_086]
MSFQTLHQVLNAFDHQASWKERRQFQQLLTCWAEVVGPAVAAQTRPIALQRQVLQVATASSVWAQTLAFERLRILEKLNQRVPLGLTDIRFSTAHWCSTSPPSAAAESAIVWQNHPSRLQSPRPPVRLPTATDPHTAFRNWAKTIRLQSQQLPLCPVCHSPTPEGELIRWSVCALCAAQQFGQEFGQAAPPSDRSTSPLSASLPDAAPPSSIP